ncbi:YfhD family protein [Bacillus cereus]|uniref:YfhD family protein n=1 Tax=Bacillus cereus TaxID=1396 RepID=A0A9X7GMJ7_BACCE|nr:YfhD family protein [Bacillus cereus]
MQRRINARRLCRMNKKNFKQSKAADGIDVEFSRELADHNDLEANARANAADARQKRQSTEK